MAEQTLLQIVQDFCRRQGLQAPSVVVTSTDETVLQAWALLNEEMDDEPTRGDFQALKTISTFGYGTAIDYAAFDLSALAGYKFMLPRTLWNTTINLPVVGPISDPEWQAMVNLNVSQAQDAYRITQSILRIFPGNSVSQNYRFEYLSDAPVLLAAGGFGSVFVADGDMPRLPTQLVKAGLRWRWRREKGQPYAEEMRAYEILVASELARDQAPGAICLDNKPEYDRVVEPGLLIAAGNWNV